MKKSSKKSAFTLMEIILVVVIAAILLTIGFFATRGAQFVSDVLRTETENIIATLRRAQLESMFGVSGTDFTVDIASDRLTVSPSADVLLLDGVTIGSIDLVGGGNDIVFIHNLGTAVPSGTFTILGPRGQMRRVRVSPSGRIDWEIP